MSGPGIPLSELIEELLDEAPPSERWNYAARIFEVVGEVLGSSRWSTGHGRVHPENITIGQQVELHPPGPEKAGTARDPWTWSVEPVDFPTPDWDRIHLLRIATLVAGGRGALESSDLFGACRQWLRQFEERPITDRARELVRRASESLDRFQGSMARGEAVQELREKMTEVLVGKDDARYLRRADEEEFRRQFADLGDSFDHHISIELMILGARRESEIEALALEFLTWGRFSEDSDFLRISAPHNAVRILESFGMSAEDAKAHVQGLLAEKGWVTVEDPALANVLHQALDASAEGASISRLGDELRRRSHLGLTPELARRFIHRAVAVGRPKSK